MLETYRHKIIDLIIAL